MPDCMELYFVPKKIKENFNFKQVPQNIPLKSYAKSGDICAAFFIGDKVDSKKKNTK